MFKLEMSDRAEKEILGITHADFGEWFQIHWGFDEELSEVITIHHSPENAKQNPQLVSIVVLANLFCKLRGLDYGYVEPIQVSMKDEFAWKVLSKNNVDLNKMDLERFTMDLDAKISEVKQIVKETYRDIGE